MFVRRTAAFRHLEIRTHKRWRQDAAPCLNTARKSGADFLLALKGNQSTLETEVEDYFDTAPVDELATKTTIEKGHGRIETRLYAASKNTSLDQGR